jgi:uncharacterized protein with FMN-binding domain
MSSNVKKIAISLFVVAAFGLYVWHTKNEQGSVAVGAITTATNLASDNTATSANTTSPSSNSATPAAAYKDGAYTGSTTDAYYGNVQVRVTISGGKLTNVEFLQRPDTHRQSVQINQQAMPMLQQEAIQSQSAQIDGVSGATLTSQAFIESLGAALSQAKA